MIICLLGITLAIAYIIVFIYSLIYIAKTGTPVWKPFGLGIASMMIGYFGASFLLLALNAVVEASSGYSFIDNSVAPFYLALVTAALISIVMLMMLKKPLRERRSAYEALAFGLGVVAPMLAYKTASVVWSNLAYIISGAGYSASTLLLLEGTLGTAIVLLEALLAILLSYMIFKGKTWTGFLLVLTLELLVYASGSVQTAFGWPNFIGLGTGFAVCAAVTVIDVKVWNRFPPFKREARTQRGVKSAIHWPDPGEDGR